MSVSAIAVPARRAVEALCIVLPLLLTGCGDTSQSPENPDIIGVPPNIAYLGVDYSYNFGALGGDNLLNYSLVNNPSWMALEATTNNARKGIVLRGVPGITGGRRGEDDLGENANIRITTNDGKLIGDSEFSVEVRHNPLEISDATITEGEAYEPDVEKDSEQVCDIPAMDVAPEAAVEHRKLVVGRDATYESASRTYTSRRALIRVDLGEPSVEPVSVRFRIQGQEACEQGEELPCEYEEGNQGRALYGEDLVLDGNAHQGSGFPEPPDYVEYISEDENAATGLLNFEAGQTTCFIPVWVHDDNLAEDSEFFDVELERVTEGIASVENNGAVASRSVTIEDDTPTASFEHEQVVLSEGSRREVTATLSRPNDTGKPLYTAVEVAEVDDDTAWQAELCSDDSGSDCVTVDENNNNASLTLTFDKGAEATDFYVKAQTESDEPLREELVRKLQFVSDFQYGRELAAVTTDSTVDATINEWTSDTDLSALGFTVQSLVPGELGEVYVAGADGASAIGLHSINRLGSMDTADDDAVALGAVNGNADWPSLASEGRVRLAFAGENPGTASAPQVTRYLGLAYPVTSEKGRAQLLGSTVATQDDDNGNRVIVRSGSGETGDALWGMALADGKWAQRALAVDQEGSLYAGGLGNSSVRLTSIDTGEDSDGNPVAEQAWSESLEATTPSLNGLFTSGVGGVTTIGDDGGAVDPGTNVGGQDFYLFTRNTGDGSVNERVQFGTEGDDRVALAGAGGSRFWLAGNQSGPYSINDSDGFDPSEGANDAPFLIAVDSAGTARATFPSAEGNESISSIQALSVSGDDVFIAGKQEDATVYLMGLRYDSDDQDSDDDTRITKRWQVSVDGANSVIDMAPFKDDKLFVVFETDSGAQVLRPYDQRGKRLTQ
ncbi:hypothetical protein ACMDCT_03510 [Halomonadaceae bacterium KBTZ08]